MAQWYPIYDDTTKDVQGAGFFAEPGSVDPGTGKTLGSGQAGDIPNDLVEIGDPPVYNYTYNTETNTVVHK
jgi:hypothetical protein